MQKEQIIEKINSLMNGTPAVKSTMETVADLQAQADQAIGSKRDDLAKQLRLAQGVMKRMIHEYAVLPVYSEMQAEFADCIDAAGAVATSWQLAYSEVMHPLNMHLFPQVSCRNTAVAGLVRA